MVTEIRWLDKLLRIPLFYKILLTNSLIVGLGAIVGTLVTMWHVQNYPDDFHLELIGVFALSGILISFGVNWLVLKLALKPLDHLQSGVDQLSVGKSGITVQTGALSDPRFDRLIATFNRLVAAQERDSQQLHRLSQEILQAQEVERQRMARELHDEAAQALTSLLVQLRLLERSQNPEEARRRVHELRELTAQALEEVRRVALELRPTILDDLGLGAALEWRVDELKKAYPVEVKAQMAGVEEHLPRDLELVFYRVAQEALNNIGRHSGASHATLSLSQGNNSLTLEISDNGKGFILENYRSGEVRGLGLLGMRERLALVGGELTIDSAPGKGTRLVASAPFRRNLIKGLSDVKDKSVIG